MAERTSYEPGIFSWAELATTDLAAAQRFYGDLFGWDYEDRPIGDDAVYSMARLGSRYAVGMYEQGDDERRAGVPPHWNSYVTVASADESAERAKELGGSVVAGPFDVFDSGRMVVVADPGGATLGLWEPREHIGAQVVNEVGAISWNDLATHDAAQAKDFYRGLLGWDYDEANEEIAGYTIVQHAGASEGRQGGIRQMRPEEEGIPSYWSVYFPVEDTGDAGEQLSAAGGSVHVPPTEVPAGRFSVVADPQGAVFALFEGPLDP